MQEEKMSNARNFTVPYFDELPNMPLYLEQVLTTVNKILEPVLQEPMTGAMISNYIKHGALPAPNKKKYDREHLCYLIVIALAKPVFTVQQISKFFNIQRMTYPLDIAFNFFCRELENSLKEAFDFTGKALPCIETKRTEQTILVRAMVLSIANQIYVTQKYLT